MNMHVNGIYLVFSKGSPNGILRGFFSPLIRRTYWGYKISWVCFCCNLFNLFS